MSSDEVRFREAHLDRVRPHLELGAEQGFDVAQ
jgi:hypothetical protein